MGDKAFDLLAGGFAEGFGTAKIDGVTPGRESC
jgi:hypothetical protein